MKQVIDRKTYDTETATCIADNRYWDGSNFERSGRNTYLYKTKKDNYFLHSTTQWTGEKDTIKALTKEEAKDWYEKLPEKNCDYVTSFGEEAEEA